MAAAIPDIYINDLPQSCTSPIRLYADDSSLYETLDNLDAIDKKLNESLKQIAEWANTWKVTFNATKTESITFSLKKHHREHLY